jgi:hypothetical protein
MIQYAKEGELTRAQITIRSTSLNLGDLRLGQAKLLVRSNDVLADRERGHAVRVVGYTTELLGTLSSGERLPPASTAPPCVH